MGESSKPVDCPRCEMDRIIHGLMAEKWPTARQVVARRLEAFFERWIVKDRDWETS